MKIERLRNSRCTCTVFTFQKKIKIYKKKTDQFAEHFAHGVLNQVIRFDLCPMAYLVQSTILMFHEDSF